MVGASVISQVGPNIYLFICLFVCLACPFLRLCMQCKFKPQNGIRAGWDKNVHGKYFIYSPTPGPRHIKFLVNILCCWANLFSTCLFSDFLKIIIIYILDRKEFCRKNNEKVTSENCK